MSTVRASSEAIRQMQSDLTKTINDLNAASSKILAVRSISGEWNDAQGEKFRELMTKISRLIGSPVSTLQGAKPKLERLAQSLDAYGSVKF